MNPFQHWQSRFADMPGMALSMLGSGIAYLCSGMPARITDPFVSGAIALTERIIEEKRFGQAPRETDPALVARGKQGAYRAHALACAIRAREWPKAEELEIVIEQQIAYTREYTRKSEWDINQSMYLCAVELCLVTGQAERANELLRQRFSFKRSKARHEALSMLCEGILGRSRLPQPTRPFLAFFDLRRFPASRPPVIAFEREFEVFDIRENQVLQMAMIKHRYIDGMGAAADWDRILGLITE